MKKVYADIKPLNKHQMYWRMNGAAAKGHRTIEGRPYVLAGTGDKATVEAAAKTRRSAGQSCRIMKNTTHYGGWELWVSRVDKK